MEITSIPKNGGLNLDDDLENLPKDDYQVAENLMISLGNKAFSKLYGTKSIHSISGTCFGVFKFRDYVALFVKEGTAPVYHKIYLIYDDNTKELVFNHKFDLDTSIHLISCKLINEELLVFHNGVDEVMKVHLGMSKLTLGYDYDSGGFSIVGLQEGYIKADRWYSDGYLYIKGNQSIITSTKSVIVFQVQPITALQRYLQFTNNIIEGYVQNTNEFVITSKFASVNPNTFPFPSNCVFKPFTEEYIGYRKKSTLDYYLINTPPLDPPSTAFISEANRAVNKLKNGVFQFQIKYVYWDKSESSWSEYSELLVDDSDGFLQYNQNNGVIITAIHPTLYDRDNVKEIIFAVRRNAGILYEFDRKTTINEEFFPNPYEAPLVVSTTFYNDEVLFAISDDDAKSQFDRIGTKVGDLELVDNSILLLADNKLPNEPVSPNVELSFTKKLSEEISYTDYVFSYRHVYFTLVSNGEIDDYYVKVPNVYLSEGIFYMYRGRDDSIIKKNRQYIISRNYNSKGGSIDPIADSVELEVTKAIGEESRGREFVLGRAFTYFDFSPTQTIGTVYKVDVKLLRREPTKGKLQLIRERNSDFLVKTTNTSDLIDEIQTWVNTDSGLNSFAYGSTGGTITTKLKKAGSFIADIGGVTTEYSSNSVQISSGYSSVVGGNDYHWYQVDEFRVTIEKVNAQTYLKKTFKNQVEHPFGLRYKDKFGRILSDVKIGSIDLSAQNNINTYYEGLINIKHLAPKSAVKYTLLYAGNKNYKQFIYAVIGEVNPDSFSSSTEVKLKLDFKTYNEAYGAKLSYTFTEGDLIQKVIESDNGTPANFTESSNKTPYRVISGDVLDIIVQRDLDNIFLEGEVVVIYTPKKTIDEDNLLYYESGYTFDVVDGAHKSNQLSQEFGKLIGYTISYENGSADYYTGYLGNTPYLVFKIDTAITPAPSSGGFAILNTKYKGTYDITQVPMGGSIIEIYVLNLSVSPAEGINFASHDIYLTWTGGSTTLVTIDEKYAIISLKEFGDVYLRYKGANYDSLIESSSISDEYDSEYWGKGRPVIVGENDKINSGGMIYYSRPYYDNTNINGISTIYGSNFAEYSTVNGDIKRIVERGTDLVVFKEKEISNISIAVTDIETGTGDILQALSGKVISPNEKKYLYDGGIGNQIYSIEKFKNNLYFADPTNKSYNRIAQNGITPISEIKVDSYFNTLFEDSSALIFATFDRETYSLILHIKSNTLNKQMIWHESRSRWVGYLGISCERMIYRNRLLTFNEDNLYTHTESDRNDIYGTQVESKLTKTFNIKDGDVNLLKSWLSIMLDPLFLDDDTKVLISNEEGQETEILKSDFARDGAGYWAEILRDKNTPNLTYPILDGEVMESKYLTVTVSSKSKVDEKLNIIELNFLPIENH